MEAFRPQKSPLSDRFLGLFSKPETPVTSPNSAGNGGGGGVELEEGEVFWIGTDFSASGPSSPPTTVANVNTSPTVFPTGAFRRIPEKNFGILAALPEDEKKRTLRNPSFLQRKPSISSSSSASTSPSSARMMAAIPKPKPEYAFSVPAGRLHQQSAPVNVPVIPRRARRGFQEEEEMDGEEKAAEDEYDEMLPPHEIVARASAKDSPMTTFSVLEGVGRTLKGRDLRRVRNAVLRQTGFLH